MTPVQLLKQLVGYTDALGDIEMIVEVYRRLTEAETELKILKEQGCKPAKKG